MKKCISKNVIDLLLFKINLIYLYSKNNKRFKTLKIFKPFFQVVLVFSKIVQNLLKLFFISCSRNQFCLK